MSLKKSPFFELRSGSIDTLLFIVKTADLEALRAELTKRFESTPEFFANDAVAIDIRRLADDERVPVAAIGQMLEEVRMRPSGVVAQPAQQTWAAEAGLPFLEANDRRGSVAQEKSALAAAEPEAPSALSVAEAAVSATLVIDKPLRSGQQIYTRGDLVVLGPVSHGAEIIAHGNIHVYGPMRGRALAGVHGKQDARIFCTCFEPELVSVAGVYRTAEHPLANDLLGKPVQIWLEQEKLMIEPLRLT